jgi:PEP-CTERM motif
MLAVLLVAIGAPNAYADSFTYTYTDTDDGISWTTAAISAVTMETSVPGADLTASSNSGFTTGCVTSSVVLDSLGGGGTSTLFFSGCNFAGEIQSDDGFALSDYSTPGTYVSPNFAHDTLVVTAAVAAPEPSSVALMLLGVGLVFVMRKRVGQGLPQAS